MQSHPKGCAPATKAENTANIAKLTIMCSGIRWKNQRREIFSLKASRGKVIKRGGGFRHKDALDRSALDNNRDAVDGQDIAIDMLITPTSFVIRTVVPLS
ncbi:hypothetical protein ACLKA6_012196 [Drosophila palustris]